VIRNSRGAMLTLYPTTHFWICTLNNNAYSASQEENGTIIQSHLSWLHHANDSVHCALNFGTGANISLSLHESGFATPIHRGQNITVKGNCSRFMGNLSCTYINGNGVEQTIILLNYLHVPDCAILLISPHQIRAETKFPSDGLNHLQTCNIDSKWSFNHNWILHFIAITFRLH